MPIKWMELEIEGWEEDKKAYVYNSLELLYRF